MYVSTRLEIVIWTFVRNRHYPGVEGWGYGGKRERARDRNETIGVHFAFAKG